jgi:hypothetical protein
MFLDTLYRNRAKHKYLLLKGYRLKGALSSKDRTGPRINIDGKWSDREATLESLVI